LLLFLSFKIKKKEKKKAFTPNHQFGRQEKDFIHQASNFFELVKIGGEKIK
jgi:hypothetical protein